MLRSKDDAPTTGYEASSVCSCSFLQPFEWEAKGSRVCSELIRDSVIQKVYRLHDVNIPLAASHVSRVATVYYLHPRGSDCWRSHRNFAHSKNHVKHDII